MKRCPECDSQVSNDDIRCPSCGVAFDETSGATALLPGSREKESLHSTESADGARFAAGTMLAGRYRIVSLLGRGGMGEVYKAEDLKLKQIVALKFLPDALALDGAALTRFHNEVRITRQISHPSVCRVYDINEAEGMHFLSMEFIDGEDLAVLLRRIGRLPGDKATEIARQICAGLAAAHDNGVLHRDLKPANIMIDGRGRARVTDFGVAVVAKQLTGADAASGTAAYMAPEQLRGEEVTQRSDIFSLGLVLYELFTGKRVYESNDVLELLKLHEESTPTTPSSLIRNIDPLIERVILRCLEKEPKNRPASAIQVAAALPGGDPLAAALAAGETPSPEMVAASGEDTGFRPVVSVGLFVWIVASLVLVAVLGNSVMWRAQATRGNSPDQLTLKARDIVSKLGYPEEPADTAIGLQTYPFTQEQESYIDANERLAADRWNSLTRLRQGPLYFWYRQSPAYLHPWDSDTFGWVTENDPASTLVPGMIWLQLEPNGDLRFFQARPEERYVARDSAAPVDWGQVFGLAGLDMATFSPTDPTWTIPVQSDTQAAWIGPYPGRPDIPLRVEAASYAGRPVSFFIKAPWEREPMTPIPPPNDAILFAIITSLFFVLLFGAIWLARKNMRRGRGDRRGATRLAFFTFGVTLLGWVLGADHNPIQTEFLNFLNVGLAQSMFVGGLVWLIYLALEPYVRRRWPETIVSWTRAIGGDVRNTLVGKHVLIGIAAGTMTIVLMALQDVIGKSIHSAPNFSGSIQQWEGARAFVASGVLSSINASVIGSLFLFFLIFLIRVITRRRWLTCVIYASFFTLAFVTATTGSMVNVFLIAMNHLLLAVLMIRFGLLSMVVASWVGYVVRFTPLTTDLSAWHGGYTIAVFVLVFALAALAFQQSLGGQKLFQGGLLEE